MKIKKKRIIIFFLIIFITFFLLYVTFLKEKNNDFITIKKDVSQETEEKEENKREDKLDEKAKNKIIIHISGEVRNEGIYEVDEDKRIFDVIEMAGGLTEQASLEEINLAEFIEDGEKIYIPKKEDIVKNVEKQETNNGGKVSNKTEEKININTANTTELATLPGIGKTIAEEIIEYRNKNGKFKNIKDIKNVKGIGDSKYKKIENLIKI